MLFAACATVAAVVNAAAFAYGAGRTWRTRAALVYTALLAAVFAAGGWGAAAGAWDRWPPEQAASLALVSVWCFLAVVLSFDAWTARRALHESGRDAAARP